jgi:hypothetical protein
VAAKPVAARAAKSAAKPVAKTTAKATAKAPAKAPAKAAVKATAKVVARPAAKAVAKAVAAQGPALAVKNAAKAIVKAAKDAPAAGRTGAAQPPQAARPALVRDSFTMPDGEYAVLASVKQACLKAGFEIKKSELLRIGVALVGRLDTATLRQVLDSLPQLKTGRPPSQ